MSNLETILFSALMSTFFSKLEKMLLTGNTHVIKTKPVLMYNFSDPGIQFVIFNPWKLPLNWIAFYQDSFVISPD